MRNGCILQLGLISHVGKPIADWFKEREKDRGWVIIMCASEYKLFVNPYIPDAEASAHHCEFPASQ